MTRIHCLALAAPVLLGGCAMFSPQRAEAPELDPLFQQVHTLRVAAVYNETDFQFRYRFPTVEPSWYHSYNVYRDGAWVDAGGEGFYEDRLSVMIDDGSVPEFARYGAYIVARPGTRGYPGEVPGGEVAESFIAERGLGSDVRKYIPQSREAGASRDTVWRAGLGEEEIMALRREGVFLNTWQWRAHRSNPIGYADQGYVLEYRNSSGGRGMYADNWDEENNRPLLMYDTSVAPAPALDHDRLVAREYGQDDLYYLSEDFAVPFDPDHEWREGDTLPAVYLREPSGSRGAIAAAGHWDGDAWNVRVTRSLAAPDPLDSKAIEPGRTYRVQFASHTGATGGRWHLVSMPVTMGVDSIGVLQAQRVEGDLDGAEAEWLDIPLIYPGLLTLDDLLEDPQAEYLLQRAANNPLDRMAVSDFLDYVLRHEAEVRERMR